MMRVTLDSRLEELRVELKLMAVQESMRLHRIARRAENHGVSAATISEIREEASIMYNTMTSYPGRLLAWDFRYKYKYAFKY